MKTYHCDECNEQIPADGHCEAHPSARVSTIVSPLTPTVTLTSYNMGLDATEADYDLWVAYVCAKIDAACGFAVCVNADPFSGGGALDLIEHADDEQREKITDVLRDLWNEGCAVSFAAEA